MQHIKKPLTKQSAKRLFNFTLSELTSPQPTKLTYMIENSCHEVLGLVGLTLPEKPNGSAEIGVMILPQWQRQKVAHQAKQSLIATAFERMDLRHIYAHCEVTNIAANRANQKLGFDLDDSFHDPKKGTEIKVWKISRPDSK